MNVFLAELSAGLPTADQAIRIVVRLLMATVLAAVIGYEREARGKAAGLRTHMLVGLGCAIFVLVPLETGMSPADLSRVIQGVAAGIGFLGAGAILKLPSTREIEGLTTAAGIWMTAAASLAAGMGRFGLAAIAVAIALVILGAVDRLGNAGRR